MISPATNILSIRKWVHEDRSSTWRVDRRPQSHIIDIEKWVELRKTIDAIVVKTCSSYRDCVILTNTANNIVRVFYDSFKWWRWRYKFISTLHFVSVNEIDYIYVICKIIFLFSNHQLYYHYLLPFRKKVIWFQKFHDLSIRVVVSLRKPVGNDVTKFIYIFVLHKYTFCRKRF